MLTRLELKIPPALLVLIIALIMWLIAENFSRLELSPAIRYSGFGVLLVIGVLMIVLGGFNFKAANTTVNPITPDSTTVLVTSGIYRYSRNPMYIGFLLMLVGWALFLASLPALVMTAVYILYMNRLQIEPEERALEKIFGAEYIAYKTNVRRWL